MPKHLKKQAHLPTAAEILGLLKATAAEMRRQHGVCTVALFGSYARGTQRRTSDIDLLVEFDDRAVSLFDVLKLEADLTARWGRPVHVTERTAVPERARARIETEALVA